MTPSDPAGTTTPVVNVPHAYTRLVADTAMLIAYAMVWHGLAFVPHVVPSVPVAETNVPRPVATTHGSVDGSSVFGVHVVAQLAPDG